MKTGNVIKNEYGNILIVTEIGFDTIRWISFSSEGSSGISKSEDHEEIKHCDCSYPGYEFDTDCEFCKGTGKYIVKIEGLRHAAILASNVKQYITDNLLKNFNW